MFSLNITQPAIEGTWVMKGKNHVFWTIASMTVLTGLGASFFALVPVLFPERQELMSMVNSWHSTLSYLCATGMGGMLLLIGKP